MKDKDKGKGKDKDAVCHNMICNVLLREGGYVNHGADKGGPTNFGITLKTYQKWCGRKVTENDIKKMSVDEASAIYRKNYLEKPGIHKLPEKLQGQVFDCAVNHGPNRAIKLLQTALNAKGFGLLAVDGKLGRLSLIASKNAQEWLGPQFTNDLVNTRVKFYKKIVKRDRSQAVFLKGWLRRAEGFRLDIW